MEDYKLKLVSVNGGDCTIEVTYPDATKRTMTVAGLPTSAEDAQDFVEAAKKYMEAYLAGERQAQVAPSAAVTALVGKSTTINI